LLHKKENLSDITRKIILRNTIVGLRNLDSSKWNDLKVKYINLEGKLKESKSKISIPLILESTARLTPLTHIALNCPLL
jgi:hypothetical protein